MNEQSEPRSSLPERHEKSLEETLNSLSESSPAAPREFVPERNQTHVLQTRRSAQQRSGSYANRLRFWALPDANIRWWIIRENDDGGTDGLLQSVPIIYVPPTTIKERVEAADCCRSWLRTRLRDHFHEAGFQLLKRMMAGVIVMVGSLFGLLLPGELKIFDLGFLLSSLIFCAYTAVRYGARFLSAAELARQPFSNFVGEPFAENALLERLSRAIEFRRSRASELRGLPSDEELLDAHAYRMLIRDKVTTREELAALGRAVQQRIGVDLKSVKFGERMRAEGLELESATVYRDLALAAAEIGLSPDGEK